MPGYGLTGTEGRGLLSALSEDALVDCYALAQISRLLDTPKVSLSIGLEVE